MEIKTKSAFKACLCQVVAPNPRELGGVAAGKELQQQEGLRRKERRWQQKRNISCVCGAAYSMKIAQSLQIIKSHSLLYYSAYLKMIPVFSSSGLNLTGAFE